MQQGGEGQQGGAGRQGGEGRQGGDGRQPPGAPAAPGLAPLADEESATQLSAASAELPHQTPDGYIPMVPESMTSRDEDDFTGSRNHDVVYLTELQCVDYDNVSQKVRLGSQSSRRGVPGPRARVPSTGSTTSSGYLRPCKYGGVEEWRPDGEKGSSGTRRPQDIWILRAENQLQGLEGSGPEEGVVGMEELALQAAGLHVRDKGRSFYKREELPYIDEDTFGAAQRGEAGRSAASTASCSPESTPPEPRPLSEESEPEDAALQPLLRKSAVASGATTGEDSSTHACDASPKGHSDQSSCSPRSSESERSSVGLGRSDSERSSSSPGSSPSSPGRHGPAGPGPSRKPGSLPQGARRNKDSVALSDTSSGFHSDFSPDESAEDPLRRFSPEVLV